MGTGMPFTFAWLRWLIRSFRSAGATEQSFTTKGDNNRIDDVVLYPDARHTVKRGEIVGFVRGYVPFVGWPTLLMQEIMKLSSRARSKE